jgi:hypothetical protein
MSAQPALTLLSWYSSQAATLASSLINAADTLPEELQVDYDECEVKALTPEVIGQSAETCKEQLIANWYEPLESQISLQKPDAVKLLQQSPPTSLESLHDQLKDLPFDVCIGGTLFSQWLRDDFQHTSLVLPGQYPLGWLLVLKGDGHKYLVSKRWLEYVPAKIIEKGDMTYIQCHELSVDSATALEQAMPVWHLLSTSPEGGFLPKNLQPEFERNSQYNSADGSISITVIGRDPSLRELQEACVARNFRGLADGRPIKKIIYVFMEADRAKKHVHALWLREIDCHTFIEGKEVNLTADYTPPAYCKPEWILES